MTEPIEPEWLEIETVLAAHEKTLAVDGGASGLQDRGLLESALERPRNRFFHGSVDDVSELAATYAVGIAKNHPFADGNKRSVFIAAATFLYLNGAPLDATQEDATRIMFGVAAGEIDIDQLSLWIRDNTIAR